MFKIECSFILITTYRFQSSSFQDLSVKVENMKLQMSEKDKQIQNQKTLNTKLDKVYHIYCVAYEIFDFW